MTPAILFLIVAVALIGTELLIMQFSVFWFLFFGLGALATSLICWFIPALTLVEATGIFVIASLAASALLYPMLRKWQEKPAPIAGNDALGQSVKVIQEISAGQTGKVTWSGTEWPAQLHEGESAFAVGEAAIIRKLEGIRLIVGR